MRQAASGQSANRASIPLIFTGGWHVGEDLLVPLAFLKFQREFELEADRLAVGALAQSGYDPKALLDYISRTQPQDTEATKLRSALPPRSTRIPALEEAIASVAVRTPAPNDGLAEIQRILRPLIEDRPTEPPSLLKPKVH
jgi:predicted Zn-dependent protease